MTFETSGSVQAIHRPQNVQKIHQGAFLSVPSLPKVQNGIRGTRFGGEEVDVAVNLEFVGEEAPVVAASVWRIEA